MDHLHQHRNNIILKLHNIQTAEVNGNRTCLANTKLIILQKQT